MLKMADEDLLVEHQPSLTSAQIFEVERNGFEL